MGISLPATDPAPARSDGLKPSLAPVGSKRKESMTRKIMLLALSVVSAAFFALPTMGSAAELHIEGATGHLFTGGGPEGSSSAVGEPTFKCSSMAASGELATETTAKSFRRTKHAVSPFWAWYCTVGRRLREQV
jgi:hypothetical protein